MQNTTPLRRRRKYWFYIPLATVLFITLYLLASDQGIGPEILVAALSGTFATAFFAYRAHADDAKFMRELLLHFNSRYDKLNDELQTMLNAPSGTPVEEFEKIIIIDYFNLCAEEWLFRRAGYVWDPVWESWENGMRQYATLDCVRNIWMEERQSNSYYGWELPGVLPTVIATENVPI